MAKRGICKHCNEEKTIIGRGLCWKCYDNLKKEGTLDELYPTKRKKSGVPAPSRPKKKKPSTRGLDINDILHAVDMITIALEPLPPEGRQTVINHVLNKLDQ